MTNRAEIYKENTEKSDEAKRLKTEFADIAPYDDSVFHEKLENLSKEPGFEHAIRYVMPNVDFNKFKEQLLATNNQHEFQSKVMAGFLMGLEKKTTDGVDADGMENIKAGKSYTFISNHRDIVLDASFLNLCLLRHNKPLTQVAIGNNLLIYEWITDLVKLNRSFIVKRNVKRLEALDAARKLSAYIHFVITKMNESVWIAQREGRAKDSNDLTQESLIKMLALGGDGDTENKLLEINLLPVSISYEYDPNDYLKVREYLLKRRDPEYKKSQHDDLLSMETGLLGYKGRVFFHICECINDELKKACSENECGRKVTKEACALIDKAIHSAYHFFPINYIAYDVLKGTDRFSFYYTPEDREAFDKYIAGQLAKVKVDDITEEERKFMYDTILSCYANPVSNYITATEG